MVCNLQVFSQVENEAQLAYILSHEIAHYKKKHVINKYVENTNTVKKSGYGSSYDDLIDNSYQKISSKGQKIIYQSLVIAYNGHDGQMRKSGEPYIYHPIEVAKIVAEDIGLDYVSIASAILHDVVEDTSITLDDLNESVGLDISRIVDGLTKISTLKKNEGYAKSISH